MTKRDAETLARGLLESLPRRWAHVCGVAECAARLQLPATIIDAAWLHDIGYAPEVKDTGMHAIDGANYLRDRRWPGEVVQLVAHHTGAWSEANERGLGADLDAFPTPDDASLDSLTLCDLLVGPAGEPVRPQERLDEILTRYQPGHPVHRAVSRSKPELMFRARRAWSQLSPDVRGVTPF